MSNSQHECFLEVKFLAVSGSSVFQDEKEFNPFAKVHITQRSRAYFSHSDCVLGYTATVQLFQRPSNSSNDRSLTEMAGLHGHPPNNINTLT